MSGTWDVPGTVLSVDSSGTSVSGSPRNLGFPLDVLRELWFTVVVDNHPMEGDQTMAHAAIRTEHSGAKRGKGAYWGRKVEAKAESNRKRRQNDKLASREQD